MKRIIPTLNEFINEKKLNSGKDLTMDNLGELPYGFVNMHWESAIYNYGYSNKLFKYTPRGGKTVIKSKMKEFIEFLINDGYVSLEGLRDMLDEYRKMNAKKGKDISKIVYNIQNKRDKMPTLVVHNKWQYFMGKIGSTSAVFTTIKKTNDEGDVFSNPQNGYEMRGYTQSAPKPINKLPTWDAIIFTGGYPGAFDDGDKYKVMPANEITRYLDRQDDQTFYVYKV